MKYKYQVLIVIVLVALSLAAFGRIAGNGFIKTSDDSMYIIQNNDIHHGITPDSIHWALTTAYFSYWHPLTWLSHAADWSLFGSDASGHHLVSLLLHMGAVIFLFLFLNKTTNNIGCAAFAAAFFALHPLRVESVAYAAERKDVLSMFFAMACLYVYAFYAAGSRLSYYFLCLILFALALMSKPMLVTLPFVLLLFDYWPLQRWGNDVSPDHHHSIGRLIGEKIPFLALSIASCMVTIRGQHKLGLVIPMENLPVFDRVQNAIISYVSYLGKTLWPVDLAAFYPYKNALPLWQISVSGIILISVTVFVIYKVRKMPFLFAGWFLYLGTLVPVIGIIQVGELAMADRYTYLPSAGIAIGLAYGIPYLFQNRERRRRILLPAGITVLVILSVLTWRQCGWWMNDAQLWNHALKVTKDNYFAHNNIGIALYDEGKIEEALDHYEKATRIKPDFVEAHNNKGNIYVNMDRYQSALDAFNESIRLNPAHANAYNNRGIVYVHLGQYQKALTDFNKAIALNPRHAYAYLNRGINYVRLNQYQLALNDFDEAIRLKPDDADFYFCRANIYSSHHK